MLCIFICWPCFRWVSTAEDIWRAPNPEVRDLAEAKATGEYVSEKERKALVQITQENWDVHQLFLDG